MSDNKETGLVGLVCDLSRFIGLSSAYMEQMLKFVPQTSEDGLLLHQLHQEWVDEIGILYASLKESDITH